MCVWVFVCKQTDHHGEDEATAEEGDWEPDGHLDSDGHRADATVCRTVQAGLLQLTDVIPTH